MQRLVRRLFCVCIATILMIPAYAQEAIEPVQNLSDQAHVYHVLPGTEEWNEMEPQERYAACAVSEAEVEGMTTDALVETVLNYPYLINIYAYDSLALGIEEVSAYFPGLQELLSRNDAAEALNRYLDNRVSMLDSDEIDLHAYDAQVLLEMALPAAQSQTALNSNNYGTVTTPNGSAVTVIVDMSWAEVSSYLGIFPPINFDVALEQSELLEMTYPSATLYRDPAPNYNCHSYAWYSTSSSNQYWMENPSLYISDGSYEGRTAVVGCKVTYQNSNYLYTHSGIVVGTPGGPVTVRSKWGALGVFTHDVNDCPYLGDDEGVFVTTWDLA